jgi:hypothetical protein
MVVAAYVVLIPPSVKLSARAAAVHSATFLFIVDTSELLPVVAETFNLLQKCYNSTEVMITNRNIYVNTLFNFSESA